MKILRGFNQGSEEWFNQHLGIASASRAAAVMDFTAKGAEGAQRRLYRLEKVAEILSGIACSDHYVSPEMRAGTAEEPKARAAYELEEGVMVEQVGFVVGDDERTGFSPDGLVGDKGAIECKCPKTTTHLRWMDEGVIPEEHLPQLYFGLMVHPGLEWIDFVSRDGGMSKDPALFGPILPRRYVQFSIRLWRKDCLEQIERARLAAERFNADVDATIERIQKRAPELPEVILEQIDDPLEISAEDIAWAQRGFKDA